MSGVSTEKLNDVIVYIFQQVLKQAAEDCAEEAAQIAADKARKHVKEAFAKFAAATKCDSSFEMASGTMLLTVKLPDQLIAAGKTAMLNALLGREPKP